MDFSGKHVWIIGASEGIGRALACELAARGARLYLSARNGQKLVDLVAGLGGPHCAIPLDVTDTAAITGALGQIAHLDAVIYMAGEYRPGRIEHMTASDIEDVTAVNFTAPLHVVREVLPRLRAAKGMIALCASVAGYRGLPKGQPYSAAKAALINFAETLRSEEAASGVDVRVISPGFVRTRMTAKNDFAMPMMIEPEEAARAIADGLAGRSFEIRFPRPFVWFMGFLRLLPDMLYFRLVKRL